VPSVGGRPDRDISRHMLAMMIEPRVEEIFAMAHREIRKSHVAELLGAGVVLTGGASSLPGMPELAEQVFDLPVRRGGPTGVTGLVEAVSDPRFATGVGLAQHAFLSDGKPRTADGSWMGRISFGIRRWIEELV
jgi:cell division protein FtsA